MKVGRPSKVDEIRVRDLAIGAIKKKYGSEEDGLMALLGSGEPSLMKYVFELGFGKPKEKIEHEGDFNINWNEVRTYEQK